MTTSEPQSFDREYQAIKTGRAVVELTGWSIVSIAGTDRQSFLHNFCTNDVKRLTPGASCEAFFTNVKGKTLGHGLICCRENELVIIGAPGQTARLIAHLDRYVIREDVKLSDESDKRSCLLVLGGVSNDDSAAVTQWDIVGRSDSKIVAIDSAKAAETIRGLVADGHLLAGHEAFETTRIEAGMPVYGVDFDEETLPQEVGRDKHAISFTKGCYLGQETVARIDALGHVNRQLVGVRFLGAVVPTTGLELTRDSRAVGSTTSAVFSPASNAPLALAMIRREANSVGTRLDSVVGECEVVALPVN